MKEKWEFVNRKNHKSLKHPFQIRGFRKKWKMR